MSDFQSLLLPPTFLALVALTFSPFDLILIIVMGLVMNYCAPSLVILVSAVLVLFYCADRRCQIHTTQTKIHVGVSNKIQSSSSSISLLKYSKACLCGYFVGTR